MRPEIARDTIAVVLAGGNGTRLGDLTRRQCKPALPFGGHFRNIDFTLSNCVNSQIRRVGVLTQYKAQTLIGHLTNGWNFLPRQLGEFVDVWPAQQRLQAAWYAGTADAVYQNLDLILAQRARYTLLLAGDHIYKMDYRPMLEQHAQSGANVTIACVPVPLEEASAFGILGIDAAQSVCSFKEKPPPSTLDAAGGKVLASMGIYVFDTDYLASRLERDARAVESAHDLGRDVLPAAVRDDRVAAYRFTDAAGNPRYWRDVGTLEAYWQAHMELLADAPAMDLYDPDWPVWTAPEQLPPAKLIYTRGHRGFVANSMLSGGVLVRGAEIANSVLGTRVQVGRDTVLDESVILPGARIGANCFLRRVIVDSDTQIPDGTIVDARMGLPPVVTLLTREWIAGATRCPMPKKSSMPTPANRKVDRGKCVWSTDAQRVQTFSVARSPSTERLS